jgi:hypothetical protein
VVKSLIVFNSFVTGGNDAFVGLQSGDQVTVDPDAPNAGLLLGYAIVSPVDIGSDILPRMSTAAGAAGFLFSLGAGEYSFWIQDTNVPLSQYGLRIEMAPIPVPPSAPLVLTGFAGSRGALAAEADEPWPRSNRYLARRKSGRSSGSAEKTTTAGRRTLSETPRLGTAARSIWRIVPRVALAKHRQIAAELEAEILAILDAASVASQPHDEN